MEKENNFKESKVGIVVVTYNKVDVLESCLSSILKSDYSNYIIIVVDNASTDETESVIKNNFPDAKLLKSKINLGYTGGNNFGIKYALKILDCSYILIANDDVFFEIDTIKKMVHAAENDKSIGVVNPAIFCYENPKKLCQEFGKYNFYLGLHYQNLKGVLYPEEIGLVRGTCFLVNREVFDKIGLMDERFFLYFDEANLSYRIKRNGYKIMYIPSAIVYHKTTSSYSGKSNPAVLYYTTRNELLFASDYLNLFLFIPLWFLRIFIRIVIHIIKEKNLGVIITIFRGILDFARRRYGSATS